MFEYNDSNIHAHPLSLIRNKSRGRGNRLELLSAFLIVHSIFNCKHFQAFYIRSITHSSIYICSIIFATIHSNIMKSPNIPLALTGPSLSTYGNEWMKWNYSCIMLPYVHFSNASRARGISAAYLNLKHRICTERILWKITNYNFITTFIIFV